MPREDLVYWILLSRDSAAAGDGDGALMGVGGLWESEADPLLATDDHYALTDKVELGCQRTCLLKYRMFSPRYIR